MEVEELRKRHTDCVYFLASPLTCNKGVHCEYRHSEISRLNPRDCWYWLAGTCLNPTCGFRHPPLEVHGEAPAKSAPYHQSTIPREKSIIPCYYFFNGFCNKGDRCLFLHASNVSAPSEKSTKSNLAITNKVPSEKTSVVVNNTPIVDNGHLKPSQTIPDVHKTAQFQPKDAVLLQLPDKNDLQPSPSQELSVSECEGISNESNPVLTDPVNNFIQKSWYTDQSSEEEQENQFDPEDVMESTPGIELLDERAENLKYEDDPRYLLAFDRESKNMKSHFFAHGCETEDQVDYDTIYTDPELSEDERYDDFDALYNSHFFCNFGEDSATIFSRKRKLIAADNRRVIDPTENVWNHRIIDGHPSIPLSTRHESSLMTGQYQGRWERCSVSWNQGRRSNPSLSVTRIKNSVPHLSKRQYQTNTHAKEHSPYEFLGKSLGRQRRSSQASNIFRGRNRFSQIRHGQGKRKVNKGSRKLVLSNRNASAEFQGPKPLHEILERKRRQSSIVGENEYIN